MLEMRAEVGNDWFKNQANIVDILTRNWAPGHKALYLQNSGEFKIVALGADIHPKPFAGFCVYATEDLIQQNPGLLKSFVKAALESVKYVKDNPNWAIQDDVKKLGVAQDAAKVAVADLSPSWTQGGLGSGNDLVAALKNVYQYGKDTGTIPQTDMLKIEDVVDIRFL